MYYQYVVAFYMSWRGEALQSNVRHHRVGKKAATPMRPARQKTCKAMGHPAAPADAASRLLGAIAWPKREGVNSSR
jgi:hypothetical protein